MNQTTETPAACAVRGPKKFIAATSCDAPENVLTLDDRQGLAGDPLTRLHRGVGPADPARRRA
jgi:hypothetical protein